MMKAVVFTVLLLLSIIAFFVGMNWDDTGDEENTMWGPVLCLLSLSGAVVFLILAVISWVKVLG